ncbi:MAG: hypothetical protein J0G94_06710 [Sphingomonadales bacterium]|nr:hypothetical protein [Sphingomonadales bacterium]
MLAILMNYDKSLRYPFKSNVFFFSLEGQAGLRWAPRGRLLSTTANSGRSACAHSTPIPSRSIQPLNHVP